jgi:deoxyribonuclease-1
MRYPIALLIFLVLVRSAEAQKNCTEGIPCGNSCISAEKTCRIGTTASAPAFLLCVPAGYWKVLRVGYCVT